MKRIGLSHLGIVNSQVLSQTIDVNMDELSNAIMGASFVKDEAEEFSNAMARAESLIEKGLRVFLIEGVEIIAHTEKEAYKRFKHRNKKK